MLTDKQIAEIRERVERATVGPWKSKYDYDSDGHVIRMGTALNSPGRYESHHIINYSHCLYPEDGHQYKEAESNAKFIVAARVDVPALLDTIAELRFRLNAANGIIDVIRGAMGRCLDEIDNAIDALPEGGKRDE